MTIGERIKERRIQLGMSQEELAHKLGYKSRSSINKIELGGQNLTQKKIKAIAEALETTPEYIMGWDVVSRAKDLYIEPPVDVGLEIEEYLNKATVERLRFIQAYIETILEKGDKE